MDSRIIKLALVEFEYWFREKFSQSLYHTDINNWEERSDLIQFDYSIFIKEGHWLNDDELREIELKIKETFKNYREHCKVEGLDCSGTQYMVLSCKIIISGEKFERDVILNRMKYRYISRK